MMKKFYFLFLMMLLPLAASAQKEFYGVQSNDGQTWTYYYDTEKEKRGGTADPGNGLIISTDVVTVVFDSSVADYRPTSMTGWFNGCKKLTTITGIEYLNTSEVRMMNMMFMDCSLLTSVDLSYFNTSKVTTMVGMFQKCHSLSRLDLTSFNTSNVTSMEGMFSLCNSLRVVDLSSFNTSKVVNMSGMFAYCEGLKTVYADESRWSTAAVTNGSSMFCYCDALKGGNGTTWEKDGYVEDHSFARVDKPGQKGYFTQKDGPAMESCDMSEIPTDNAYYAATSFLCERGILDGSKVDGKYMVEDWLIRHDLANITFRGLFTLNGREIPSTFVSDQYPGIYDDLKSDAPYYQAAKALLYLDYGDGITPFDRDRDGFFPNGNESRINILKELMEAFNIKPDMEGTDNPFPNDPDITSLPESSPIKMGYVRQAAKLGIITTENEKFRPYDDCLRGEAFLMLARIIQKIEAGEITDPNPQESDFLDPNSGTGTEDPNAEAYYTVSNNFKTLTFYYDSQKTSRTNILFSGGLEPDEYGFPTWYSCRDKFTSVVFDSSFDNYKTLTSTECWFINCSSVTSITGLEYLHTDNVTNMRSMFYECSSLTNIDLSHFNTENVQNFIGMFDGCSGLTSLDVSGFNTAKATKMSGMFEKCSGITELNLLNFNTANVIDMNGMFYGCTGLTVLDLSSFNTANVTDMLAMFNNCSNLVTIYVGEGWSTAKAGGSYDNSMFYNCQKLVGGKGFTYDSSKTDKDYARIDNSPTYPGYFTDKNASTGADAEPYAVLRDENTVLTFYYDDKKTERNGMNVELFTCYPSWLTQKESITSVVFDDSFSNCTMLTSTAYWFYQLENLSSITGISNLTTDNVTDMKYMFYGCSRLTSLDVTGFKTDNVTEMSSMFGGCSGLMSLDVTGFKTGNVTSMHGMFGGCSGLKSLDVRGFKTDNVTNMGAMFYGCSGLTSLDVTGFKTDNVTNLGNMFQCCSGLKSLDVRGFKTDKVIDMDNMFQLCSSLTTIYAGDGWSTAKIQDGADMFSNCTSLVGGAGTHYDGNHTDHTYAHIDGGSENPGYFTAAGAEPWQGPDEPELYAALSDNDTVLTFYYDDKKAERNGMDVGPFDYNFTQTWYEQRESITSVVFDASLSNCTSLTSTAKWFNGLQNLSSITGISNLKTDNVTDMHGMFAGCSSLTSLDVTGFKTDNVINISQMFYGCSGLTSLDVTGFKTDNVTEMYGMFDGCSGLKSLDVTGFKTDNVTSMYNMFSGCSGLTSLDVTGFKTDNVSSMAFMFYRCSGLTSLDVTGFKADNVTCMASMFSSCSGLTSLDVTGFKTDNVTDMRNMFRFCSGLTSLDLTGFKTDNVTDMDEMFYSCSGLMSLDVTGFKTDNVTNMGGMFAWCSGLTSLDLTGFKTDNVEYMSSMFQGCSGLTSLDLTGFKTDNVEYMSSMFQGCSGLKTIYAGDGWSTAKVQSGGNMFNYCTSLAGGAGTKYDANHIDYTYAHIDGGSSNPGYFTSKGGGGESPAEETEETITISKAGQTTWCSISDLDFTGVEGLKAYIAPGYNRTTGTIWLMRVFEVPANEGILLIGDPGEYKVPKKSTTTYYKNMFKGTLEPITINETEGEYTNYYLSNGTSGVGFYKVDGTQKIGANRAYLPLLKGTTQSGTRFIGIDFDDGTTSVKEVKSGEVKGEKWFTLQGQRVTKPAKGLYIKNGKKVIVR